MVTVATLDGVCGGEGLRLLVSPSVPHLEQGLVYRGLHTPTGGKPRQRDRGRGDTLNRPQGRPRHMARQKGQGEPGSKGHSVGAAHLSPILWPTFGLP